jgi:type I restriction enzyme S subunit
LIRELAVRGVITNGVLKSQTRIEDKKQKLFNIPDSWRWVKLEAVIDFINGYAFRSDEYASSGIGVVRMSDMKSGLVIPDHMKFVPIDRMNSLSKDFQVQPGDIVMGMTGATLGKPCVNRTSKTFLLNQRIGKFVPKDIDSEYLLLVLAYLERSFMNLSFGTGVNNLSTRQIKESVIPLPPADEQVQIVKIVSSLFTICDRLESSLVDTDELSTKFARSMISAST